MGARRGAGRSPACASSPSGRAWSSTRAAGGGASAAARLRARRARASPPPRRRYDVVHTASFPYFSLLAAAARAARGAVSDRRRLARGLDAGLLARVPRARSAAASAGASQRACLRVPQRAFCFSRLHERRLRELGLARRADAARGPVRRPARAARSRCRRGRSPSSPAATSPRSGSRRSCRRSRSRASRSRSPRRDLRRRARAREGRRGDRTSSGSTDVVDGARVRRTARSSSDALSTALCLVLPSRREGYGRVVIEASARGVPVVVVAGPDNAATELVEEGVNGTIAASAEPPISPMRSSRPRGGRRTCAARRSTGSGGTRSACRSVARVAKVVEAYADGLSAPCFTSCRIRAAAARRTSTCSSACPGIDSSGCISPPVRRQGSCARAWPYRCRSGSPRHDLVHVHGEVAARCAFRCSRSGLRSSRCTASTSCGE